MANCSARGDDDEFGNYQSANLARRGAKAPNARATAEHQDIQYDFLLQLEDVRTRTETMSSNHVTACIHLPI